MASSKKQIKPYKEVAGKKTPKNIEDPNSYFSKNPVWVFKCCDRSFGKWSICDCDDFYGEILDKLISYEGLTWAEIQSAAGGRAHGTNNHFIKISDMVNEAQKRASEINLDVDELFSLRLSGKKRLFGILEDGVYYVVWYTEEHDICLSIKKHT